MKKITVSVPDEVYRCARIRAAERDTSLSELVLDFLQRLEQGDDDFERRRRLQAEVLRSIGRFRGGERLRRDEVHDRDALC